MPDVRFDRYYRYADLTRIVQAYAEEFPQLVRIESIGKSYEGRDIWLLTVTNATGSDREKPALWVDGNIHATEISPSSACLYLLQTLVTGYGTDADITRCLDTRTFYIEPYCASPPLVLKINSIPAPLDSKPMPNHPTSMEVPLTGAPLEFQLLLVPLQKIKFDPRSAT